jgi:hypothetical protein
VSRTVLLQFQYFEILCVQNVYIFVLASNWWFIYNIHPGQPLITEHCLSMATMSKTDIKYKMYAALI